MSESPEFAFCDDHTAECRCRQLVGHEPPHICPCGGSWRYDADGSFQVDEFPPLTVMPALRFDEEW